MTDNTENKRSLFVFFDRKADNFLGTQIYVSQHPAPIIREFYHHLGNPQSALGLYPEDFSVLHIGFIDDDGMITPIAPLSLATGEAWLASKADHA